MPGVEILRHLDAVNSAMDEELSGIDGGMKKWFSDRMGATSYDDLLSKFDPGNHDSRWEEEKAKMDAGGGDLAARNAEERAVCYLAAARRDLRQHYMEDEISSFIRAKAAPVHWKGDFDELSQYFTSNYGTGSKV